MSLSVEGKRFFNGKPACLVNDVDAEYVLVLIVPLLHQGMIIGECINFRQGTCETFQAQLDDGTTECVDVSCYVCL